MSGVCLTAVEITADSFAADLAAETWNRTSFSRIKKGALVNLELPMQANGRFGGHIVQGHVDGTGKLLSLDPIQGISLTVARIEGTRVTVAIIPHTVEMTNLKSLKPGDPVNLEVDVIAKYVEKMLRGDSSSSGITVEKLVSKGF